MTGAWMLYCLQVAAVLALAAWILEACCRRRRMPLRWVWVGALLGSMLIPVGGWTAARWGVSVGLLTRVHPGSPAPSEGSGSSATHQPIMPIRASAVTTDAGVRWVKSFERPLRLLWPATSSVAGLYVLIAAWRLHRRRRRWFASAVGGVQVLLSRDLGPAVVGVAGSTIVLPRWALDLAPRQLRLIVTHEAEHIRAGDPWLGAISVATVVAMPWNLPLYWLARRLRHAVELDCDTRVIASYPDAHAYASLLTEIGTRTPPTGIARAAFAGSSSVLERRIRAMLHRHPQSPRWLLVAPTVVAVTLIALACDMPRPIKTEASDKAAASHPLLTRIPSVAEMAKVPADLSAKPLDMRLLAAKLVQQRYPAVYQNGLPLEQAVWFVVEAHAPGGEIRKSWIGPNTDLRWVTVGKGEYFGQTYDPKFAHTAQERAALASLRAELGDVVDHLNGNAVRVDLQSGSSFIVHIMFPKRGPMFSEQGLVAPIRAALAQSPIHLR